MQLFDIFRVSVYLLLFSASPETAPSQACGRGQVRSACLHKSSCPTTHLCWGSRTLSLHDRGYADLGALSFKQVSAVAVATHTRAATSTCPKLPQLVLPAMPSARPARVSWPRPTNPAGGLVAGATNAAAGGRRLANGRRGAPNVAPFRKHGATLRGCNRSSTPCALYCSGPLAVGWAAAGDDGHEHLPRDFVHPRIARQVVRPLRLGRPHASG